jgi:hypothetical protein
MSFMKFNACHDTSHYGPAYPFKDAEVDADSVTCLQDAKVKCVFVVNRIRRHKGFEVSPQVIIQRIQI